MICPKCNKEPEVITDDYYVCINCSKGDFDDLIDPNEEGN